MGNRTEDRGEDEGNDSRRSCRICRPSLRYRRGHPGEIRTHHDRNCDRGMPPLLVLARSIQIIIMNRFQGMDSVASFLAIRMSHPFDSPAEEAETAWSGSCRRWKQILANLLLVGVRSPFDLLVTLRPSDFESNSPRIDPLFARGCGPCAVPPPKSGRNVRQGRSAEYVL